MKSIRLFALAVVMASICSTSQASEFHLPGRPLQRAANVASAVAKPVQAAAVGVAKAKPVRSLLKVLFF